MTEYMTLLERQENMVLEYAIEGHKVSQIARMTNLTIKEVRAIAKHWKITLPKCGDYTLHSKSDLAPRVLQEHDNGLSYNQIALKLSCAPGTAYRIVKAYKGPQQRGRKVNEKKDNSIVNL